MKPSFALAVSMTSWLLCATARIRADCIFLNSTSLSTANFHADAEDRVPPPPNSGTAQNPLSAMIGGASLSGAASAHAEATSNLELDPINCRIRVFGQLSADATSGAFDPDPLASGQGSAVFEIVVPLSSPSEFRVFGEMQYVVDTGDHFPVRAHDDVSWALQIGDFGILSGVIGDVDASDTTQISNIRGPLPADTYLVRPSFAARAELVTPGDASSVSLHYDLTVVFVPEPPSTSILVVLASLLCLLAIRPIRLHEERQKKT